MACKINYNTDNKIVSVTGKDGQDSALFNSLSSHPMVESLEQAVDLYKNMYSDTLSERKETDFVLSHKTTDGTIVSSYREALNSDGQKIEVGFLDNNGEFYSLMEVNPSFDTSTLDGFVNTYIKEGLMSEKREVRNGEVYYQPAGTSQAARGVNYIYLQDALTTSLGWERYEKTRNGIKLKEKAPKESTGKVDDILQKEIKDILSKRVQTESTQELSESELKLRLLGVLNKLGIKATTITEYVKKYQIKNGVDPSAKALADIANKVVAFKNGEIELSDLSEEVSHFIVEGWNQEEIENLLRNVHRTTEWAEHSERYREIYGQEYSKEELENVVRREVLGKVLANSLTSNFSTEGKTGTQLSIIEKLRELLSDFVDYIRSVFSQQAENDLQRFTEKVNNLLYEDALSEYLNVSNIEESKFRMYSVKGASSSIKKAKVNTLATLKVVSKDLSNLIRTKVPFAAQKSRIDRVIRELSEEQDSLLEKQSVLELISVVDSMVNHLNSVLDNGEKSGEQKFMFTTEENTTYQTLQKQILPLLNMVNTNIDASSSEYGREWDNVKDQINNVTVKSVHLKSRVGNYNPQVIDRLVENIMIRHNLDNRYRNYVKAWLENVESDTSHMHRYFGQIVNSKDPLLGLTSDIVERTFSGTNQEAVPLLKSFHQKLKELGVNPSELRQLADDGYLLDSIDHAKLERHLEETRAKIRKEVTGDSRSIEEIIKLAKKGELDTLTREQNREYNKKYKAHKNAIGERFFTEQYYIEKEQKYGTEEYIDSEGNLRKGLGIAPETISLQQKYSADRNSLIQEALTDEGVIDYTRLTAESEERLKAIARERASDKSLLDQTGVYKKGIQRELSKGNEAAERIELEAKGHVQPVLVKGIWYFLDASKAHSEEARIALDLIKMDQEYIKEIEGQKALKGIPDSFMNELIRIEEEQGKEAANRFLELNASVFFNEEFWGTFSDKDSFLQRFKESEVAKDYQTELQILQELNNERSEILKKYKTLNKPHETDASKMDALAKDKIRDLDAQIQTAYKQLSSVLKEEGGEQETNPIYLTEVNEAYLNETKELGIYGDPKAEMAFILKNAPQTTADRIASFRFSLRKYTSNPEASLPASHLRIIEDYFRKSASKGLEGMSVDVEDIALTYARTQLSSYYKRLVPTEYSSIFDKKDTMSVVDYVKALENSDFIDVRPNYSYYEAQEVRFKNPNYKPDFEGGYIQPKKNITLPDGSKISFKNERYEAMFAPDSQGNATKNKKMFDALQELKNLQRGTLKNLGLEGSHNLYKLPQINKTGIDRAVDFLKNVSTDKVVQNLKELAVYRVDDVEYGESVGAVNKIPTYYTRDVENKNELTDELFYSYALMAQQAVLHKHRKNNLGDMLAIQDAILKRDYPKGKAAEASVTMAMFKNYMDYAIFGIKESQELKMNVLGREVDLTKFARMLLGFVKFRNLGFSLIVPATSGITQEIQYQIDQMVGEITNKQSARMATREFGKLAYDAMKEMGKFSSESKLNVMGEFFGIYDLEARFKNSNYKYLMRNIDNAAFMTHQMANFPVTPRVMLAVLMDQRLVLDSSGKGVIMNFNQFKAQQDPSLTTNQVEQEWKKHESEAIYNYLDVDKVGVKFKKGLESKINHPETERYLREKMNAITDQIKRNVSQFDAQITNSQRVAAQRNFALNFFMTHRGWMSIVTSNRTKSAHRNLMSGEVEEGSYVSLYNYLGDVARGMMNKKGLKAFREAWNGVDLEVENMRRVDGEPISLEDYKEKHSTLPMQEVMDKWETEEKITRNQGITVEELVKVRRRNMRRVAIDTAWLTAIMAISYLLMNLADDDEYEDNYALQLGNYLVLRTLNETSSSQFGLGKEMYETLSSPIVGLSTIAAMVRLPYDMVTGSEEIKSGFYKGDTKRFRAFTKVTPGMRTITDMQRITEARKNYWFHNNDTMTFSVPGLFYAAGLEKE